jgi:hypothetical protein
MSIQLFFILMPGPEHCSSGREGRGGADGERGKAGKGEINGPYVLLFSDYYFLL